MVGAGLSTNGLRSTHACRDRLSAIKDSCFAHCGMWAGSFLLNLLRSFSLREDEISDKLGLVFAALFANVSETTCLRFAHGDVAHD